MWKTGKRPAMLADLGDAPDIETLWQPCDRTSWEALFRQARRSALEQSWAYGEAVAAQHGQTVERHVVMAGAEPLALLQAFRKSYWHQIGRASGRESVGKDV